MTSKSPNGKFDKLAENVNSKLELFRKTVNDLSKNELRRVLIAAVENPVEDTVKLNGANEKLAFNLASTIKQDIIGMTLEYIKNEEILNKQQDSADNFALTKE